MSRSNGFGLRILAIFKRGPSRFGACPRSNGIERAIAIAIAVILGMRSGSDGILIEGGPPRVLPNPYNRLFEPMIDSVHPPGRWWSAGFLSTKRLAG